MIKGLTQKELQVIEKYCGGEYANRLQAIQGKHDDTTVKIVNTGMVSSGKSSLYNILINSNEKEFFPTGAARTTTKADYYDYHNISYIDTPGIDVRNEDDDLAFRTIIESDIIVMIHNIRTGPLNKSEVEWLSRIVDGMSSVEMCLSRIVFVISWKDTREREDDYSELVQNVKNQVFEIVGGKIPVFEVSAKKYQQGIEKGTEVLTKNSGIIELKQFLESYADQYIKEKYDNDRKEYISILSKTGELLRTKQEDHQQEKHNIYLKNQDKVRTRKAAWDNVYDCFSVKKKRLSNLENELKNM